MILVFGSINIDIVLPVTRFPVPGETVLGKGYEMTPGGKGANQALAACRAGSRVTLVGCAGDDGWGQRILTGLRRDGVVTSGVARSDKPTGMALIMNDANGENEIVVAPGANLDVRADQIPDELLKPGVTVMMQGEIPASQNWIMLARAKARGARTMLNISPATKIPDESLAHIDILMMNEIEVHQVAILMGINGETDMAKLARRIGDKGKFTCIVTMGPEGSLAATPEGEIIHVPALPVEVIDSMGAGDALCGTVAAALDQGKTLTEALRMGAVAGSLACTREGAQESYCYLGDIHDRLPELGETVATEG